MLAQASSKARKLTRLLHARRWIAGLRHGVAASIEHDAACFLHEFRTVLDVGANVGQFALYSLERFPGATIVCFEPLPDAKRKLDRVLLGVANARTVQVAVGSTTGHAMMHVSASPDSSSLYPITTMQAALFPNTQEARTTIVDLVPLDMVEHLRPIARPALLKIDTQGYELEVLRGAEQTLLDLDEIILEGSFVELYAGQALADDLILHLCQRGWRLHGLHSVSHDKSGRCVQADLHFVRVASASDGPPPSNRR